MSRYRFGAFVLDPESRVLLNDGQPVVMTGKILDLLIVLVERHGKVVDKDELLSQLWPGVVVEEANLTQGIFTLRKILGDNPRDHRYVATVAGRGYQFVAPVKRDTDSSHATSLSAVSAQPAHRGRLWLYAAGAAAILASVVLFWLTRPLPPPRITGTMQLTNDGKPKTLPCARAMVTDGIRVYFGGGIDSDEPYQVSAKGGEAVAISPALKDMILMDVSRERSELLLLKLESYGWDGTLWAAPLLGGAPRRLGDLIASSAAWSPDGQQLAYSRDREVHIARSDGTGVRKIATLADPNWPFWPHWSPDGRRIRFTGRRYPGEECNTGSSLWEVSADGSGLHPLLPGWNATPGECCGNWTADGKYFVFQSTKSGSNNIWAIREKAGFHRTSRQPIQLTTGPVRSSQPVPSPDGRRLFIFGSQSRGALLRHDLKSGRFARFLGGISAAGLDFSKDERWITYVSFPEGLLWRCAADGSQRLQLTFPPMAAWQGRWSPDGKWIAFEGHLPGEQFRIYVVAADGGAAQPITDGRNGEGGDFDPAWSPDGHAIAFGDLWSTAYRTPDRTIHVVDFTTHRVSNLPGSTGMWSPRWSPDGRFIAGLSAPGQKLMLYDVEQRKEAELASMPANFPAWSRNSQYVYFDVEKEETVDSWWRVGVRDRKLERVSLSEGIPSLASTWFTLGKDDSLIVLGDAGITEIYALDWEAP